MIGVYICGASAEIDRVERFARAAEERGARITHPWWKVMREVAKPDRDLPREERIEHASADLAGIRSATIVLVLVPAPGIVSKGQLAELGVAIETTSCALHVVGDERELGLFGSMADVFHADEDAALDWIGGERTTARRRAPDGG